MFALLPFAVVFAVAQAPVPAPSPTISQTAPVPVATPGILATPGPGAGLVLPPAPVIAPSFPPSASAPSGDLVGTAGPFVGLTLTDAISMALARNTDLAVSQANRRIAGYQIVAAQGAYDVQFVVTPSYSFAQIPSVSSFQAGPIGVQALQSSVQSSASLQGLTPGGGQYSFATSAQRVHSNLTLNSYDPYYETSMALNFSQALARGRGIDATRRQIQLAKINADLSSDNAVLTASATLSNTLDAYYDLVAAWKNVAIQEDALRQARVQSESNARLVKGGAAAPVDVIESDTQVDIFQNGVYSAIQNVASLQNRLKQLILSDPADPIWTANLVPVSPQTAVPAEPSLDDVVVAALRNRPEVAQLRESVRSSDVDLAFFHDQTLPQINLNLGITEQGLAGTLAPSSSNPFIASSVQQTIAINQLIARVNALEPPGTPPLPALNGTPTVIPPYTVGGLGQAYSNMFGGKYPQYTVGASVAFPLRDRTAEAQYRIALEQRKQVATQQVALIQRIQYEARNAVQAYRSARSRLSAASAARKAAEAVEASEERRFKAGQSTTFLVLQRQINVATQRGAELQAQTDLQKALVEIDRVSGSILAHNQVNLDTLGAAKQGAVPALEASPAPR